VIWGASRNIDREEDRTGVTQHTGRQWPGHSSLHEFILVVIAQLVSEGGCISGLSDSAYIERGHCRSSSARP